MRSFRVASVSVYLCFVLKGMFSNKLFEFRHALLIAANNNYK